MTYKGKQVVRQISKDGVIYRPVVENGNLLIPMWQVEPRRALVFYYEIPGELIRKICKEEE